MKITLGNHVYAIKKLNSGKRYITRTMTVKAFNKMMNSDKAYKIKGGIL